MPSDLKSAFDKSRDPDVGERIAAVRMLADHITEPVARQRLGEMLDDDNIAVFVEAAEVLVTWRGEQGLIAVLSELGRRAGDADLDYIVYKLQELQGSGEAPVLRRARALNLGELPSEVAAGVEYLEEDFGYYEPHQEW
ncbi:hypothetical protein [Nocardia donostiensis]|uniref:hypothetical protein n=1 Tax=Nocardia donostiensis TaxID=1538463 RepID=UPI00111594F8|nr:hypothetical protein [Nocardia donostiensis]